MCIIVYVIQRKYVRNDMISYEPFWRTLKTRNLNQYRLITNHNISKGILSRLKKGEYISTYTAEKLCNILDCRIEDIIEFK